MLDGTYPLYRLLEIISMKSYGAEKAHRISTNNTCAQSWVVLLSCESMQEMKLSVNAAQDEAERF